MNQIQSSTVGRSTRTAGLAAICYLVTAMAACTTRVVPVSSTTAPVASTASPSPSALIDCAESTSRLEGRSILPTFAPSYPCELENTSNHVDFCIVHASPKLSYPCSRTESVHEVVAGEGGHTQLIQRNYHMDSGCWHGISADIRSLRICDTESGETDTIAANVMGEIYPSPDRVWFAFVTWQTGNLRFEHVYRVRSNGTDLTQLDTKTLPAVGATILGWSEDGEWLALSLWDGTENGWHDYRIRTNGSGLYEAVGR